MYRMLGVFLVKTCVASSVAVTWSQVGSLVNINQTMMDFIQEAKSGNLASVL